MSVPNKSYIIACSPRSGSHLLSDGLTRTGVAGVPKERFPRPFEKDLGNAASRDALVTQPPPESSYDNEIDAQYLAEVISLGTTPNGVFGVNIHWFQLNDAIRRVTAYLNSKKSSPQETLSAALPNLHYIWLRRRDKAAQAVSWYKAIETGRYVKTNVSELTPTPQIEFDPEKIKTYMSALRSADNGWSNYFAKANIFPCIIEYEHLANNYPQTIVKVLQYLSIDAGSIEISAPRHQKASDMQSKLWIEKIQSLKR